MDGVLGGGGGAVRWKIVESGGLTKWFRDPEFIHSSLDNAHRRGNPQLLRIVCDADLKLMGNCRCLFFFA